MIFRNLTEDHDWTFGKGKQDYVKDDDAIKVNIKTRILSWQQDCFFDLLAGIDWYERLSKKSQFNLLKNDLANIILKSYGVASLSRFNAELVGRRFTSQYDIKTVYSPSVISTIERNI